MRTIRWTTEYLLSLLKPAVIVAAGLLYPVPASATEMLDQAQTESHSPATVSYSVPRAQIFTSGYFGLLERVSLYLENYEASPPSGAVLTISVQTVVERLPSGKVLVSGTIPLSAIPAPGFCDWVNVSIGSGTVVHAGTQYALVLQTSNLFSSVNWWYAYGKYARGAMALNDGTAWRIVPPEDDFAFKTFVIPDMLDQGPPENHNGFGYAVGTTLGQIFTAGMTGLIDRVRVMTVNDPTRYVWAHGPLEASVQRLKGGYPSGLALGSGSAGADAIPVYNPGWVTIGISGAPVSAGRQYALVVHEDSGEAIWFYVTNSDIFGDPQYPVGDMVILDAQGWRMFRDTEGLL